MSLEIFCVSNMLALFREMVFIPPETPWYYLLAAVAVGFAAGFVNMFAGGGSSITLPMLMFLGLPPSVANGTNRVVILMQSISGVRAFSRNKAMPEGRGWRLMLPSAAGALLGALLALRVNEDFLRVFIIVLMMAILVLVIFNPGAWVKNRADSVKAKPGPWQYAIFFLIGIYGGFLQVGVGYMLLAGLVAGCGYGMVKANALKVLIILVYTVIAVVVFYTGSQIAWGFGMVMGLGSMGGAWLGARFTLRGSNTVIRYFLIVALIAMIVKLLGLF